MTNINFIVERVKKDNTYELKVTAPDNLISTSDANVLNVVVEGMGSVLGGYGVEVDVTLPDGTMIKKLGLASTYTNPHTFSASIDNLLNNIEVGDNGQFTVDRIRIYNLGLEWVTTQPYVVHVLKTVESINYNPTDVDRLFIAINDLQQQINELRK